MDLGLDSQSFVVRAAVLVVCSTAILTAAFIGLLAVVRGEVTDPGARLPVYVLISAIVFVAALFTLENPEEPGAPIVTATVGIGVVALLLSALGGEGIVYATSHPRELLASQIVLYVIAASLICTALVYWSLHHWREFVE